MRRGGATFKTDAPKSKVILSIITLNLSGSTLRFAKGGAYYLQRSKTGFRSTHNPFLCKCWCKIKHNKKE